MRIFAAGCLAWFFITGAGSSAHAQDKKVCDLVDMADLESMLGTKVQPPQSREVADNLLFVPGQAVFSRCEYTSPFLWIDLRYSAVPDPATVDQVMKLVDEKTYEDAIPVPDLGDAAFWIAPGPRGRLIVFSGGKTTLLFGGTTLDQAKTLAVKALGGAKNTGFAYGTRLPLTKPVLSRLPAKPSQIDQLKFDLTAKAETGNAKAQFALGNFYEFGMIGPDGIPNPDYPAAAYWYQEASDRGELPASFALGKILRDGLGTTPNPGAARNLFRKAAVAGFVPAMVPLSYAYAAVNPPNDTSAHRAQRWAQQAAEANDPAGHLLVGYLWNKGFLLPPGGNKTIGYKNAMESYMKAATGGDCVALMNIGGLYFNGDGVPQDKTQAQSWFAKAEQCSGGNLEWMRDKAARYRERAAAGRVPSVQAANAPASGAGLAELQRYGKSVLALMSIALGVDVLSTDPKTGAVELNYTDLLRQIQSTRQAACLQAGLANALSCQ